MRHTQAKIGLNKNQPRIYIQGKYLSTAGFTPGKKIQVTYDKHKISIKVNNAAYKIVSSKKDGQIQVIDINSSTITDVFGNINDIQINTKFGEILITPTRTALKKLTRCKNGLEGSLFAGGGLLTFAAEEAGYKNTFAVEINQEYAEIFASNFPTSHMFNMSISEVPVDELPQVELLSIGIPCEPYSKARIKTDKTLPPEAHDLGDMAFWTLKVIDALNPASIVIEEVTGFLNSGAGHIVINALKRMGYNIKTDILSPINYGGITDRKRAVIIAYTDNYQMPIKRLNEKALSEYLGSDEKWFDKQSKPWIFKHWEEQTNKGNGFASSQYSNEDTKIGTIKKRYFAGQGDNLVIRHPEKKDTFRFFTIDEVKKIMGLPHSYLLSDTKTTSGEVLGQGVCVSLFKQVIQGFHPGVNNVMPADHCKYQLLKNKPNNFNPSNTYNSSKIEQLSLMLA